MGIGGGIFWVSEVGGHLLWVGRGECGWVEVYFE